MANKPLSAEELQDILKPKPKIKEKPVVTRFPAPPQHGPLRFVDTSSLCVVAGYWKYDEEGNKEWVKTNRGCRSQTNYRLNGIPMCCTHAIRMMNDMLYEEGFDFTDKILDEKTAERIDHEEVQGRLIRGNERLLKRVEELEAELDSR